VKGSEPLPYQGSLKRLRKWPPYLFNQSMQACHTTHLELLSHGGVPLTETRRGVTDKHTYVKKKIDTQHGRAGPVE